MVKPLRPKINWNHPLTKGLLVDIPMFEGGGAITNDLVQGTKDTITGAVWVNNIFGKSLSFAGGTATDNIASISYNFATPPFRSIHAIVYPITIDATQRRISDIPNQELLSLATGAPVTSYQVNWSTTNLVVRVPLLSTNTWHTVILTYDASNTTNRPLIWVDGVSQTVTTATAPAGTLNSSTNTLTIANGLSNTRSLNCYMALYRRWNRILSSPEAKQLYVNPWQIYIRPNRYQAVNNTLPKGFSSWASSTIYNPLIGNDIQIA